MLAAVISGYVLSIATFWILRVGRKASGWLIALLPLGLVIYFASYIEPVANGQPVVTSYEWVPSLGINLSFYLDGLSLLFALLISGIGALIIVYAGGYLKGHPQLDRFYTYLLVFMASMLGVVLAGNVLTLFVFWELTSLSSYLLIGFNHDDEKSRKAALQALLVTGGGGLALMAGLLLLGLVGGSFEFPALLAQKDAIQAHTLYLPILLLILAGAFTKSAQFPFHFWLPGAMAAPTPVSAYLHSATMVKAGIYLLARLYPVLGGTQSWTGIIVVAGTITMFVGAFLAWQQTDLKRILAYSTISSLGLLVLLLGLGTKLAIESAIVFLIAHSLYKGALFLATGIIDHETGTRDIEQLGGLHRAMPLTAIATGLAALSLAGLPPVIGFISKELIYETLFELHESGLLVLVIAFISNAFLVAIAGIVFLRPFLGTLKVTSHTPHDPSLSLWLGPLVLALTGLLIGLLPETVGTALVTSAASATLGEQVTVKLALWHGITPMLILSIVTVILGLGIYLVLPRLHRLVLALNGIYDLGPTQWYERSLNGLNRLARLQTRLLQNGYLRAYLLVIVVTTTTLAGYILASRVTITLPENWLNVRFYEVGLGILILVATLVAIQTESRLVAVAALGVVGYSISLIYVLFSAPDLAMTQFTIETLTVVLFVLVLYRMPRFAKFSTRSARLRDVVVSLTAGGLMTLFVLAVVAQPVGSHLSEYFSENSLMLAKGQNVVNVILVDFRGFDTLGEITVLAIAAVGVYTLLKSGVGKEDNSSTSQ